MAAGLRTPGGGPSSRSEGRRRPPDAVFRAQGRFLQVHVGSTFRSNGPFRTESLPYPELAWMWVRYQPESALSRWYQRRFGSGNARARKLGIVALARKQLIALWKYLEHGEMPEGAVLVPWEKKLNGRLPAAARPA